jgi:hypothetical protein
MSRCIALLLAIGGCADNIQINPGADAAPPIDAPDAPIDAPSVDAGEVPVAPLRLADTGLYFQFPDIIHPRNVEYEVRFELWADGATKRRWVRLHDGAQIDTSDMDFWSYPVGTVIFKEFSRDGLRVETRMIEKRGPALDDWVAVTYAWNAAQTDAVLELDGVADALGTGHDIPSEFLCQSCHRKQPDFVLGFSAIQLDTADTSFGLDELIDAGRLSDPPARVGPVFFPLPGDGVDQVALGYLHGNCGGCHHPGGVQRGIRLRLAVESMAQVIDTDAFTTAVDVDAELDIGAGTALIEPGEPDESIVILRMESLQSGTRMPEVGSEEVDDAGVQAVRDWILQVPAP